jgi:hypothetical protein
MEISLLITINFLPAGKLIHAYALPVKLQRLVPTTTFDYKGEAAENIFFTL